MERKVDPSSVETALYTGANDSALGTPPQGPNSIAEEGRFVPGTLLGGRYRIIGLLGVGGMGEVYRATDLTLGQSVALKFLPAEAATNQQLLERFHGEVRVARQVSHPNVCRVYDIGQVEGMPFISMEYVDGEDLASLLHRIGRLSADKAIQTARKICAGLAAAHDRGVIHRDLKPQNIMMNKRGEVLIMDFGLSAIANQLSGSEVRNGTPAYMAPEQLRGSGVTTKSDIYSLGLVLYELFTGRKPYEASGASQLLEQQEAAQLTSISSLASDVDPAVERVVRQCLDPDPARRPASALAVAAALPGSDPLAAALAAGETPSPELVASAGATEGLPRRYSIPCVLLVFLCLFASTLARDRKYAMLRTPLDMSPEVLAEKSREVAAGFGYTRRPADSTIRLEHRNLMIRYLNELPGPRKWDEWLASEAPLMAIYRESLFGLDAWPLGFVTPENPAPIRPGMASIILDGRGQLREFRGAPYLNVTGVAVDAGAVFRAMNLDQSKFTEAKADFTPMNATDTLQMWKGSHPAFPNTNVLVELGWWKGQLTHVRLVYPFTAAQEDPIRRPRSWLWKLQTNVMLFASVIGLVFVVLLARRNWRLGRTDRRGALRIAAAKLVLGLVVWIGFVHPVQGDQMLFYFFFAAAEWITISAMIWLLYLALEPAVRSRWPHSLSTWNRVLAGRWMDAQVGAHVLIGAAIGCSLWTAAEVVDIWIGGGRLISGGALSLTLGTRQWLADHANTISTALNVALIGFFCIFGLRQLLRKDLLAAIATAVLFALMQRQVVTSPDWPIVAGIFICISAILVFVLLRFGFVATMSAIFFIDSFDAILLGLDWKTWYAPAGIATLMLLLAITLWAFWRSLGTRELLGNEAADQR
jgi:serine/threonine-protein kinase